MSDGALLDLAPYWGERVVVAAIGGVTLAYLGTFAVMARRSLACVVVAQLAAAGIVGGLLLRKGTGWDVPPMVAAVLVALPGAGLFALPRNTRVPREAWLAAALAGAAAMTQGFATFLTRKAEWVSATLWGDAMIATASEQRGWAALSMALLVVHGVLRHRFLVVTGDPEMARVQGMRVGRWRAALWVSVALGLAAATRVIGALPALALTVVPPTVALLATRRLWVAFAVGTGVAGLASAAGYALSFETGLPVGPSVVAVALLALPLAAVGARRGS